MGEFDQRFEPRARLCAATQALGGTDSSSRDGARASATTRAPGEREEQKYGTGPRLLNWWVMGSGAAWPSANRTWPDPASGNSTVSSLGTSAAATPAMWFTARVSWARATLSWPTSRRAEGATSGRISVAK